MSWLTITQDTLNEAKVAPLVAACSSAALADDQPGRAAGLIQGIVNEIRNAVATCPGNRVDADPARVPASQRDLAVDLILARLKNVLEMELTPDERANVAERRRQLREIAAGRLVVDQPDAPVAPAVEKGGTSQIITQTRHRVGSDTLRSL